MALFHSDVLCPYCLQELRKKDVKLICPQCGTESQAGAFGALPRCQQPGCHHALVTNKACRICDTKLPPNILDYTKYLRFSVLGITGAGKTNFLTTMLHELRHAAGSPIVISPMDSETLTAFQENDQAIYEARRPVPATPPGTPPMPLQWVLKDKANMTKSSITTYSLTIFDGAGEDCEHIDPVISRYISGSKVLVILIDPLALPGVKDAVSQEVLHRSTTTNHDADASASMVDGLADYIRQSCNIKPGKLIDLDVAVVFTKIDAVQETFGSATVTQPSPHLARKAFVKADSDAVDAEIRDWLGARGESSFLDAVDTNFKPGKVRFFGVSSFGQPPTGDSQLGKVMPHRVLDPLMWMLSREKIIPTV